MDDPKTKGPLSLRRERDREREPGLKPPHPIPLPGEREPGLKPPHPIPLPGERELEGTANPQIFLKSPFFQCRGKDWSDNRYWRPIGEMNHIIVLRSWNSPQARVPVFSPARRGHQSRMKLAPTGAIFGQ
jgi:hypothetical protein